MLVLLNLLEKTNDSGVRLDDGQTLANRLSFGRGTD